MAFDAPPPYLKDTSEWCRRLSLSIHGLLQGKSNNVGELTLTANAASSTVTLAKGRLGSDTVILLQPTTAHAAADISTLYESSRDIPNNQFVLTHANNAQTDRTFRYALVG